MFFSNPSFVFAKTPELNKLFQHKSQGIPEKDLQALLTYVDDQDIILLIRPVEVLTQSLHTEGQYPTKNFKIKGKSSSWGPWAGFIPIDQNFSKLVGANTETIKKANRDVQTCIDLKHAYTTQLKITEKRFQELKEKQIIFLRKEKDGDYLVISYPRPHNNTSELCYAQKIDTELGIEYLIYTAEKKPFYVLADTILKKPLIADYDLLAIFNPWKNFGPDNSRRNPEITHKERCRKLSPREQLRSIENAENFFKREDPDLGNVAPITVKHINGLNDALKKGDHLACIHHNDDAGSPASNPTANYPITALVPPTEGIDSRMIETTEEFVDFINKINSLSYYRVEVNPLWELPVKWAAQRNFFLYQAKIAYANKNLESMEKTLLKIFKFIHLTDTTLIKELINLYKIMTKGNIDNDNLFEKFFDIVQSGLLVNSTLVVRLSRSLEVLLHSEALSEKNIDHLITLNNILRKDIQVFYNILDTINTVLNKDAKIIDNYLESEVKKFKKGLECTSGDITVYSSTFRP